MPEATPALIPDFTFKKPDSASGDIWVTHDEKESKILVDLEYYTVNTVSNKTSKIQFTVISHVNKKRVIKEVDFSNSQLSVDLNSRNNIIQSKHEFSLDYAPGAQKVTVKAREYIVSKDAFNDFYYLGYKQSADIVTKPSVPSVVLSDVKFEVEGAAADALALTKGKLTITIPESEDLTKIKNVGIRVFITLKGCTATNEYFDIDNDDYDGTINNTPSNPVVIDLSEGVFALPLPADLEGGGFATGTTPANFYEKITPDTQLQFQAYIRTLSGGVSALDTDVALPAVVEASVRPEPGKITSATSLQDRQVSLNITLKPADIVGEFYSVVAQEIGAQNFTNGLSKTGWRKTDIYKKTYPVKAGAETVKKLEVVKQMNRSGAIAATPAVNITGVAASFLNGSTAFLLDSTNILIVAGLTVSGAGIPADTIILSKNGLALTLSKTTTAASSGTYAFSKAATPAVINLVPIPTGNNALAFAVVRHTEEIDFNNYFDTSADTLPADQPALTQSALSNQVAAVAIEYPNSTIEFTLDKDDGQKLESTNKLTFKTNFVSDLPTVIDSPAVNIVGVSASFLNGSTTFLLDSTNDLIVAGLTVSGAGIPADTTILSKNGLALTLTKTTTAASSGTYAFSKDAVEIKPTVDLPNVDVVRIYSFVKNGKALKPTIDTDNTETGLQGYYVDISNEKDDKYILGCSVQQIIDPSILKYLTNYKDRIISSADDQSAVVLKDYAIKTQRVISVDDCPTLSGLILGVIEGVDKSTLFSSWSNSATDLKSNNKNLELVEVETQVIKGKIDKTQPGTSLNNLKWFYHNVVGSSKSQTKNADKAPFQGIRDVNDLIVYGELYEPSPSGGAQASPFDLTSNDGKYSMRARPIFDDKNSGLQATGPWGYADALLSFKKLNAPVSVTISNIPSSKVKTYRVDVEVAAKSDFKTANVQESWKVSKGTPDIFAQSVTCTIYDGYGIPLGSSQTQRVVYPESSPISQKGPIVSVLFNNVQNVKGGDVIYAEAYVNYALVGSTAGTQAGSINNRNLTALEVRPSIEIKDVRLTQFPLAKDASGNEVTGSRRVDGSEIDSLQVSTEIDFDVLTVDTSTVMCFFAVDESSFNPNGLISMSYNKVLERWESDKALPLDTIDYTTAKVLVIAGNAFSSNAYDFFVL